MKRIRDWTEFKKYLDRGLSPQEIADDDNEGQVNIILIDGALQVCFRAYKGNETDDTSTEWTEYKASYQANANKTFTDSEGVPMQRARAFASADNMRFRGTGVSATCTKTTTTNVDYQITENRYINGLEFIVKDHVHGDSAHFQVVDVDNLLGYGAGTILDQFGTSWYLAEDVSRQGPYILPYPALINAGFYLRVAYTSVGTVNNVDLKINYFLHKKG